jgi:hypothetical protein
MASDLQIDKNYEEVVRSLRESALNEATTRIGGGYSLHYVIPKGVPPDEKWFDKAPFFPGREKLNEKFVEFLTEAAKPTTGNKPNPKKGAVGDGIVIAQQVDGLAVLDRAYRSRHASSRIRMLAHATARKRGHGAENGTINQLLLEYLRKTLQQAKA